MRVSATLAFVLCALTGVSGNFAADVNKLVFRFEAPPPTTPSILSAVVDGKAWDGLLIHLLQEKDPSWHTQWDGSKIKKQSGFDIAKLFGEVDIHSKGLKLEHVAAFGDFLVLF